MASEFRLPNNTQRLAVIGRTGSGKTNFAVWALSKMPFDKQPFVIVDYKHDQLINSIDRAEHIKLGYVPKHPGVYIVQPLPDQMAEVNNWLWKVWERGKTGLYFDEMYNVPDPQKGSALRAVLTQGRSKRIPAICLSQRPAWVSRFIFSEADFICTFHLNTAQDIQRLSEMMPGNLHDRLPDYHSRWYDVGRDASFIMRPVPEGDEILDVFDRRLEKRRKIL